MLRLSVSNGFLRGPERCRLCRQIWHRLQSTSESGRSGNGTAKGLAVLIGGSVAGLLGVQGYAYADPDFRRKVEEKVPFMKPYMDRVMGEPKEHKLELQFPKIDFASLKEKIPGLGSSAKEDEEVHVPEPTVTKEDKVSVALLPLPASKKDYAKEAASQKQEMEKQDAEKTKANIALERRLNEALDAADKGLASLKAAKDAAVASVNHHTKLLREAVEDPKTDSKDPQWHSVANANDSMQFALKSNTAKEADAKKEVERLRAVVNEGRGSKRTADNKVLLAANEQLNKLSYELDEAKAKIHEALTEGKIMTEFKELVTKGREQFAKELSSILPNVNINTAGAKLSEDELNALIAHAHLRVDQIRRQLTDQLLREEQHIVQALGRQKSEDSRAAEEQVDRELKKLQEQHDLELVRKLAEKRDEWEDDLRTQLRRAAAVHSEHLEEVLRIQREQHQLEANRRVEEVKAEEKLRFQRDVALSMATLQGIEAALEARADMDSDNRLAKELWISCQHLRSAIIHGRGSGECCEARRKPLANDVMVVKEAAKKDAFIATMIKSLPDSSLSDGVYTEDDLISRFYKVRRLCRRTSLIDDTGGSLMKYLLSMVDLLRRPPQVIVHHNAQNPIDVARIDTLEILARASYFVENSDYEDALKLMQLLKGEPGRIAKDWIHDMRTHLETRAIADLLLAHTAATSVRTVY